MAILRRRLRDMTSRLMIRRTAAPFGVADGGTSVPSSR
jgi:hypothetical protein